MTNQTQQEPLKENPYSKDFLEESLSRLRVKLRDTQDTMDCVSLTIRTIERDLQDMEEKDGLANEKVS